MCVIDHVPNLRSECFLKMEYFFVFIIICEITDTWLLFLFRVKRFKYILMQFFHLSRLVCGQKGLDQKPTKKH